MVSLFKLKVVDDRDPSDLQRVYALRKNFKYLVACSLCQKLAHWWGISRFKISVLKIVYFIGITGSMEILNNDRWQICYIILVICMSALQLNNRENTNISNFLSNYLIWYRTKNSTNHAEIMNICWKISNWICNPLLSKKSDKCKSDSSIKSSVTAPITDLLLENNSFKFLHKVGVYEIKCFFIYFRVNYCIIFTAYKKNTY